jgi:hypothetical protein
MQAEYRSKGRAPLPVFFGLHFNGAAVKNQALSFPRIAF